MKPKGYPGTVDTMETTNRIKFMGNLKYRTFVAIWLNTKSSICFNCIWCKQALAYSSSFPLYAISNRTFQYTTQYNTHRILKNSKQGYLSDLDPFDSHHSLSRNIVKDPDFVIDLSFGNFQCEKFMGVCLHFFCTIWTSCHFKDNMNHPIAFI